VQTGYSDVADEQSVTDVVELALERLGGVQSRATAIRQRNSACWRDLPSHPPQR
jgi:hypothetical protein